MPIYEYKALNPENACESCRPGFEIFQKINEKPLSKCPKCKHPLTVPAADSPASHPSESETGHDDEPADPFAQFAVYDEDAEWVYEDESAS